jgi:lipopolysaccharide export system protein LptA
MIRTSVRLLILLALAARAAADVPPQPTVINAEHLESVSSDTETTTDCQGHVVVTATNMELRCDHLHMVTSRLSEQTGIIGKQMGFKTLVATGHVVILQTQGLREATCGHAEVFPAEDKIVLTIDPVVLDHGNGTRATGDEIDLYHNQRRVTGTNIRIDAPPIKDLGFNKNAAPPAPSAEPAAAPSAAPSSGDTIRVPNVTPTSSPTASGSSSAAGKP